MTLTQSKTMPLPGWGTQESGHPILDNSLTSLTWLQNLRVLDLVSPDASVSIPISPNPDDVYPRNEDSGSDKKSCIRQDSTLGVSLSPIRKCLMQSAEFSCAPRKYRNDPNKPHFSYTTLIYLAMRHSRSGKVTLSEVYKWIRINFKYYRHADSSWENSIRHNLSLNELFVKVPRSNGKGSYWKVNPDYSHSINETSSTLTGGDTTAHLPRLTGRKRTMSTINCSKPNKMRKRIKSENTSPADPCGLPGDLDWVSLLSSQKLGCGSCPSQSCRPNFGSPVLGSPDLGHIGDPVVCSPLTVPVTSATILDIPASPLIGVNRGALLEEAILKQDSPPLQLLSWDDSRPQSPSNKDIQVHPWAESKEKTLHEMRNLTKKIKPVSTAARTSMWSPDSSWSSSSTYSNAGFKKKTPLLSEACIY